MQNETQNENQLSSITADQILTTEKPVDSNSKRKTLIASIVCTAISVVCAIAFGIFIGIFFYFINSSEGS